MARKPSEKSTTSAITFQAALRDKHDMTVAESREVVRTILQIMENSLKEDRDIVFNGIGTLKTEIRPPRVSMLPKTGQHILTSERRFLKFTPSPVIERKINEDAGRPRTYEVLTEEEAKKLMKK